MTLLIAHSPKGGVGTTFLSARLAMQLVQQGHEVTLIDFTYQDGAKLYFGLPPGQALSALGDSEADPLVVAGVQLLQGHAAALDPAMQRRLQSGEIIAHRSRIYIADIASDDRALKAMLLPHAALHLCALLPRASSLAALTKVDPEHPVVGLEKTLFVLNQVDDRQRLSRDSHAFLRQLLGERLIGTIRRDEALDESLAAFETLVKFAPSSVILPDLLSLTDAIGRRCGILPDQDQDHDQRLQASA